MDKKIMELKDYGNNICYNIKKIKYVEKGSLNHLFFGNIISIHSLNVKLGFFGEKFIKKLLELNNIEILEHKLQKINNEKIDIDLLFKYNNIIYYFELKSNLNLDSEKIKATICKCKKIEYFLQKKYPENNIKTGILNWSIYNNIHNSKSKIFIKNNLNIYYFKNFLDIINFNWEEKDFYNYFLDLGKIIQKF